MYEMSIHGIRRIIDGASIPMAEGNRDYEAYLEWVAAGNEPAPYEAPSAPVPQQITPYQARMALLAAGHLSAIEALMADSGTDQAARIAWEYATVWERNSAFISVLGPAIGLSEGQIDDLFIAAAAVT